MYSKCSEKMGFDTKKEASKAVTVVKYQRDVKLKVYKCNKCELWHLSSKYGDDDEY